MDKEEPILIASVVAENNGELYSTRIKAGEHSFIADEPVVIGGKDTGAQPGDYLCAALASCTAITLRMYTERKKWNVQHIKVITRLEKETSTTPAKHTFVCEVSVTGDLNEEQKKRMLQIAKACPIHKLLCTPSELVTVLAE